MGKDSHNEMEKSMLSAEARQKFDELVALLAAKRAFVCDGLPYNLTMRPGSTCSLYCLMNDSKGMDYVNTNLWYPGLTKPRAMLISKERVTQKLNLFRLYLPRIKKVRS